MDGTVVMTTEEQQVYRLVLEVLENRLSIVELSQLIRKSYRQCQRIVGKVRDRQLFGVKHGNLDRIPVNKVNLALKARVINLLRVKYYDFNLSHFQEKLLEVEGLEIGRETSRKWAHEAQLVKRLKRRAEDVLTSRDLVCQKRECLFSFFLLTCRATSCGLFLLLGFKCNPAVDKDRNGLKA